MFCYPYDQVKSSKYGHNTVIFGLVDGYYGAPAVQNVNEVSSRAVFKAKLITLTS